VNPEATVNPEKPRHAENIEDSQASTAEAEAPDGAGAERADRA
jgi:hypothetical protein